MNNYIYKMSNGYVSVHIQGGLGNQIYQISAALNYANKYNKELIFCDDDISPSLSPSHGYTVWKTLFNNHFKLLSKEEYNNINFNKESDNNTYVNGNVQLFGYYEEFRNISEYSKNYIYNIICSSDLYLNAKIFYIKLKILFNDEDDNNYCFIHVRRGDYISILNYTTDIEYFNNSYNYINNLNNNTKFFLFSDDLEWCKNNIKYKNLYYIDHINDHKIEFILMTLFKNAIIDSSTFSWWGAYFGDNKNIIIAPKKHRVHNPSDIYPNNWITL